MGVPVSHDDLHNDVVGALDGGHPPVPRVEVLHGAVAVHLVAERGGVLGDADGAAVVH